MSLRFNPFSVFAASTAPCGLYARSRWLAEDSEAWRKDFEDTVNRLNEGQGEDGSWRGSIFETIRRLFGLHLTVRQPTSQIEKGLDWLTLGAGNVSAWLAYHQMPKIRKKELGSLPFSPGNSLYLVISSWLFLSSLFGRENDPRVIGCYEMLERRRSQSLVGWGGRTSSSNILRAFVVHPRYSRSNAVRVLVKALSDIQRPDGTWPESIPFFHTVNALAHLDIQESDTQLEKAFDYLAHSQNRDGTWGRSDREWKTFLVVHAMKRKALL